MEIQWKKTIETWDDNNKEVIFREQLIMEVDDTHFLYKLIPGLVKSGYVELLSDDQEQVNNINRPTVQRKEYMVKGANQAESQNSEIQQR
jgi:hypothetical protein